MRLAFVVQRYGLEVHGGAEMECRIYAEALARTHDVTVFTTCARDFTTWADFYPPGPTTLNGVRVERFPVDAPRDLAAFNEFSEFVFTKPHERDDEVEWMRLQGPYSSPLLAAIERQAAEYDAFVFMTYLYATTYFGLPLVREKAILIPTAHDEFTIYLGIFDELYALPQGLLYNTTTEEAFLRRRFPALPFVGYEVGLGVDLPPAPPPPPGDEPPLLLYIGRVHTSKSCEELLEYFSRYKAERASPVRLAFAGRADIPLPEAEGVTHLGFVDEATKRAWLERASLVVVPSKVESLSIVCLEAWAASRPTLVSAGSEVLREQSLRSGGGLFYSSYAEFAACLDLLLADAELRQGLAAQGRRFVAESYSHSVVEARLEHALTALIASFAPPS